RFTSETIPNGTSDRPRRAGRKSVEPPPRAAPGTARGRATAASRWRPDPVIDTDGPRPLRSTLPTRDDGDTGPTSLRTGRWPFPGRRSASGLFGGARRESSSARGLATRRSKSGLPSRTRPRQTIARSGRYGAESRGRVPRGSPDGIARTGGRGRVAVEAPADAIRAVPRPGRGRVHARSAPTLP